MPCPNATPGTVRPTNRAFERLHFASALHNVVIPNEVEGSAFFLGGTRLQLRSGDRGNPKFPIWFSLH
jgi:hypothetical protein